MGLSLEKGERIRTHSHSFVGLKLWVLLSNLDWLVQTSSVNTCKPLFLIYRNYVWFVIIGDVHQFYRQLSYPWRSLIWESVDVEIIKLKEKGVVALP